MASSSELRARFIGDLGNLQQFFGAIQGQAAGAASALEKIGRTNISGQLGILADINKVGPNASGIRNLSIELDHLNGVIKTTGEYGIKLSNGDFLALGKYSEATGNVDALVAALKNLTLAQTDLDASNSKLKVGMEQIDAAQKARVGEIDASIQATKTHIAELREAISAINVPINNIRGQVGANPAADTAEQAIIREQQLAPLIAKRQGMISDLGLSTIKLNAADKSYQDTLQNDPALVALDKRATALQKITGAEIQAATAAKELADSQLQSAYSGPITTQPAGYKQLPSNLVAALENQGFPKADELKALQGATFNNPVYDLQRQVVNYGGTFQKTLNDDTQVTANWSAQLDSSGKLITRFGGQLSGVSNILKQIGRDFQKVTEFVIATTVVFGALRYATQQIQTLTDLNYSLQKFAITAKLTPEEAGQSFQKLSEIANNTATPLNELIGAADDIALATQRAGQSTEGWQHQILALTESVGVFTNLTGIDTVSATDLLTASMKQLGITADGIPAILSKITAVAGGQSQAIADITKGLSTMAEAGRIANLSVDQQIATVQVLSQVTSKSPAEVATAFKNLVGSLGSPAALKALDSYNIKVKETDGSLRNILDVYGDINDKIKSGVVPTGDVQALVRAISGGPRRAPDAAALLAAIDQITAATKKSEEASNEAALANARVLDTTKAKFVQLQNAVDAAVFQKFGDEFKGAIGTLLTLLTNLIKIFNAVPTGVINAAIQIGLFFVAIRVGTRVLVSLGEIIGEGIGAFNGLAASIGRATIAQEEYNVASRGGVTRGGALIGGASSISRGTLTSAAAGALVGAGLSAATGGTPLQDIGGAIQGIGFAVSALPAPAAKAAGIIGILAGTFLQMAGSAKEATDQVDEATKVVAAFQNYKDAATSVESLTDAQSKLNGQIKDAQAHGQTDAVAANQADYAKNTFDLIVASQQLQKTRDDLIKQLPASDQVEARNVLALNKTGDAVDSLVFKYEKLLLKTAHPELNLDLVSGGLPKPTLVGPATTLSETGSTLSKLTPEYFPKNALGSTDLGQIPLALVDLKELASQADRVKKLFNDDFTAITHSFDPTVQNLDLIDGAIKNLEEHGDPAASKMRGLFNTFVEQYDPLKKLNDNLAIYSSYIDALQVFNAPKAAELSKVFQAVNDILPQITSLPQTNPVPGGIGPPTPTAAGQAALDLQQALADSAAKGAIQYDELKKALTEVFNILPPNLKGSLTLQEFLNGATERYSLDAEKMGVASREATRDLQEGATDAATALDTLGKSLEANVATEIAKVQADLQGGLIKQSAADKDISRLKQYQKDIAQITSAFQEVGSQPGFAEAFDSIKSSFESIPGLSDAANLSVSDFVSRILDLAKTYGLNKEQLIKLLATMLDFKRILDDLSKINVIIPINVLVKLPTKQLEALKLFLQTQISVFKAINSFFPGSEDSAIKQLQDQITAINDVIALNSDVSSIQKTFKQGSGTTSSSGSKSGPNVSTLDLPKEIVSALDESDLIKQAIANAKKLQSQIPGATKDAKNDIVELLDGTKRVLEVRGVKEEYLRKALEELAAIEQKRLDFETKADTIRRIRIGAGDFSAIANVPVNSVTGVSASGGAANILLNITGAVLTPAQLAQFANLVAAALKKQLANA